MEEKFRYFNVKTFIVDISRVWWQVYVWNYGGRVMLQGVARNVAAKPASKSAYSSKFSEINCRQTQSPGFMLLYNRSCGTALCEAAGPSRDQQALMKRYFLFSPEISEHDVVRMPRVALQENPHISLFRQDNPNLWAGVHQLVASGVDTYGT